jgi:hypothetical protein
MPADLIDASVERGAKIVIAVLEMATCRKLSMHAHEAAKRVIVVRSTRVATGT